LTGRSCAAIGGSAAAFRALGFRTREDSDESLAWLGEAFLGWAVRNGRAYATRDAGPFRCRDATRDASRPAGADPGDVLLVGRVLGLLSGIGKQLGSEVDLAATLVPYLARLA